MSDKLDKLITLNPGIECPEKYLELFSEAASIEELRKKFIEKSYQCDAEQCLLPFFRGLFQKYMELRTKVFAELKSEYINPKLINDYFISMGNQSAVIFRLKYAKSIPENDINIFLNKARSLMLRELREYLGLCSQ
jgi:hypothetical protein